MLVAVVLAPGLFATTAFVAPKGRDTNPCTATRPCASPQRAIETGALRVQLAPGRYSLRQGIRLTAKNRGLSLIGDRAILDGGISLDKGGRAYREGDSTRIPASVRNRVRVFDLPDRGYGQLEVRGFLGARPIGAAELYANGIRQPLSGWPNGDWARTGDAEGKDTFAVDDRAKNWGPGGWVHGYWMFDWADAYRPIVKIQDSKLTMGGDAGEFGLAKGRRFRALNLPEELDSPGEWWREERKLYVLPKGAKDDLSLSVLGEPLLQAENVDGLTIRGIQFRNGRASAIAIRGGDGVKIQNCAAIGMGTDGFRLEGVRNARVEGCDLTQLGESGIGISGGDRSTLEAGNNVVRDCRVWNFSQWARTYRPGVQIDGVGNHVEHCEISDAPHNAILLSGNDHVIEGCSFARVCRETGDAGAVYMGRDTTMRGVRVEANLFRDIGPTVTTEGNYTNVIAVYLDDCWAGTTIRRNIFDIRGQGVMVGGGRDNLVERNVFLNCHPAVSVDQRGTGWAKDFFKDGGGWGFFDRIRAVKADQPPYSTRYPQLATIFKVNAALAEGNVVRNNVAIGGKWLELLDGLQPSQVGAIGNVTMEKGDVSDARKVIRDLPKLREVGLVTRKGRPFISR